jgi:O-antigen ligase
MDELVQLANAIMIASIFAVPFCGVRHSVSIQLVLMPFAHIYFVGAGLVASLICQVLVSNANGERRFDVPYLILYPWAIWGVAAAISLAFNGVTARSLFQSGEFIFYGLVGSLIFQLVVGGYSNLKHVLGSLMVTAFLLGLALSYLYKTSGVQPGYFIGSNEGAFILIVCGLVVPAYWVSAAADWREIAFGWAVISISLLAIYLGESRAGIGFGLVIVGSFILSRVVGVSILKASVAIGVLLILASQHPTAQSMYTKVFDTERNFSNIERAALIETCFSLFAEQPITGWGWGTMENLLEQYSLAKNSYPHPHNTYAHFATEIGIGGLACLALLFWLLWRIAVQNYRAGRHNEALFAAYCLITLIVLGMVNDYFYGANRGIIVAVMLGLAAAVQAPPRIAHQLTPAS